MKNRKGIEIEVRVINSRIFVCKKGENIGCPIDGFIRVLQSCGEDTTELETMVADIRNKYPELREVKR